MSRARRFGLTLAVAAVVCAGVAGSARAVNKTYVGPASGAGARWNDPLNWNLTGLPGPSDVAKIVHADGTSRNVAFDVSATVGEVQVGNAGLGTNTLTQSGAFALTAGILRVAGNNNEKGVFAHAAGGNRYGSLAVGFGTATNGAYNLSGGSVSGFSGDSMLVGFGGTGHFN